MSKKRGIVKMCLYLLSIGVLASGIYIATTTNSQLNAEQKKFDEKLYNFTKTYEYQSAVDKKMTALNEKYLNHEIKHEKYVEECKILSSNGYVYELYLENESAENKETIKRQKENIENKHMKLGVVNAATALGIAGGIACLTEAVIHKNKER